MEKKLNTLTARMILGGLALHAILLPLLFYGQMYIVEESHEERFINDVRKYSRFLADVFELDGTIDNRDHVVRLLDSVVLGSNGVFAELVEGDMHLSSSLLTKELKNSYIEDFSFGQHDDHIYFLSIHLNIPQRKIVLNMGFDEKTTIAQIKSAQHELLVILFVYLIASIAAIVLISTRMTKPLKLLQNASRKIAKGRYSEQLSVDSRLTEINELAADLESMRYELVSINASLQQEILEKEEVDKRRQILENKLRQAQKMETVGIMAGGISHEFNNILLPIFLYTEQAQHDLPDNSPVQNHLQRIHKSASRAKNLIVKILTFSRQAGNQEIKAEDVSAIVEEALELLRALIPSTIVLHQELNAKGCKILAVHDQIHQIMMNLCSNAFQSIGDTDGSILVKLDRFIVDQQFSQEHPLLEAGNYIRLSIHDTGTGIDRANLDRIFEPFYTTRAVGKGTGLGLSVVHGIAVTHKGDITVESEIGKGTVFNVYLPELVEEC